MFREWTAVHGQTAHLAWELTEAGFVPILQVIDQVVEKYGRIDILVNNAGEQHTVENIEDLLPEQLERTFRTNIFSQFYLVRYRFPGRIIVSIVYPEALTVGVCGATCWSYPVWLKDIFHSYIFQCSVHGCQKNLYDLTAQNSIPIFAGSLNLLWMLLKIAWVSGRFVTTMLVTHDGWTLLWVTSKQAIFATHLCLFGYNLSWHIVYMCGVSLHFGVTVLWRICGVWFIFRFWTQQACTPPHEGRQYYCEHHLRECIQGQCNSFGLHCY